MTHQGNGFMQDRRLALQEILGLGAAVTVPFDLFGQQGVNRSIGRKRSHSDDPTAEHLVVARKFQAERVSGVFDVRAFGATGDGKALDTPAVNKAIEAAASAGGGTVRFPAGTYLCFSIHLKSNVTLYLDHGSTILGATPPEGGGRGYDPPEPGPGNHFEDFGHRHWHNALIWGVGLENISILGPGLIYGKGLLRGTGIGTDPMGTTLYPMRYPMEGTPQSVRPIPIIGQGDKCIALKDCHNVILRDFSILHGGHFGILATGVDNLTIDNLLIDTERDGMDLDCCWNTRVTNCTVNDPYDDGICPKSSDALGYSRPTKNMVMSNCFVTGGYEVGSVYDGTWKSFPLPAGRGSRGRFHRFHHNGRFKCGTESMGGFQNITVTNCVFEHTMGLALETVDGALLEDVSISNVTMRDVGVAPLFMRLGSRMRGPAGVPVGRLRRVFISNLIASNADGRYASVLSGIPGHLIEDVKLDDIYIQSQGGGIRQDAALQPPEKENGYPEPTMFGPMPAYGFYIRHVKGLEMSHVEVEPMKDDARPAYIFHDVHDVDLLRIKAKVTPGRPTIKISDSSNFNLDLSRPLPEKHLETVAQEQI